MYCMSKEKILEIKRGSYYFHGHVILLSFIFVQHYIYTRLCPFVLKPTPLIFAFYFGWKIRDWMKIVAMICFLIPFCRFDFKNY